jgi:peptidoglycan hydrolase-like protein with peptidoglycan-binding domain
VEALVRAIKKGDRGAAVEDVQRRLLALGYDLGPTGVDGVFLGETLGAVREFQRQAQIAEDGLVGSQTWSALVDATFTLGDRLLYLRYPYLHGADVRTLQRVLNTLGFACGEPDGIFGTFTERAVREFQHNVGHPADGIVGAETVKALENLRHVWEGRESDTPVAWKVAPARAAEVLSRTGLHVLWHGEAARDVAERLSNLAQASGTDGLATREARDEPQADDGLTVVLGGPGQTDAQDGVPVVCAGDDSAEMLAARVFTALSAERPRPARILVEVDEGAADEERVRQAVAVGLLDGLCAALA